MGAVVARSQAPEDETKQRRKLENTKWGKGAGSPTESGKPEVRMSYGAVHQQLGFVKGDKCPYLVSSQGLGRSDSAQAGPPSQGTPA